MSRFKAMLVAAAAAAIAAITLVALPAIGDTGTKATQTDDPDVSALAACLARHGLNGAPTSARELKPWVASKETADPGGVRAALAACQPSAPDRGAPAGPDVQTTITCLRSHGIDAPTAPEDFKRWVGEQEQTGVSKALENALSACKISLGPNAQGQVPANPDCGAPEEKTGPHAEKPKQPASRSDTNSP